MGNETRSLDFFAIALLCHFLAHLSDKKSNGYAMNEGSIFLQVRELGKQFLLRSEKRVDSIIADMGSELLGWTLSIKTGPTASSSKTQQEKQLRHTGLRRQAA